MYGRYAVSIERVKVHVTENNRQKGDKKFQTVVVCFMSYTIRIAVYNSYYVKKKTGNFILNARSNITRFVYK